MSGPVPPRALETIEEPAVHTSADPPDGLPHSAAPAGKSPATRIRLRIALGGIPKYWQFVDSGRDVVALVESLYFDLALYMEQEPQRILRDEGATGLNALAMLEAVGRGAERPSEIASRLGAAQTNLSRLLQQLLDASVRLGQLRRIASPRGLWSSVACQIVRPRDLSPRSRYLRTACNSRTPCLISLRGQPRSK